MIAKWDDTIRAITETDSFKEVAERLNGRVTYLGHEEFQALVHSDIKTMRGTLKSLGMIESTDD